MRILHLDMRAPPKAWTEVARGRVTAAYALSALSHAALFSGAAYWFAGSLAHEQSLAAASAGPAKTVDSEIEIELPALSDDGSLMGATPVHQPVPALRGGGAALARPDVRDDGRGGEDTSREPAFNLADTDDGIYLTPDPPSRIDRDQLPRVHSSEHRASRENWRTSREPMELTFVASGSAKTRPLPRKRAARDASAGRDGTGVPERVGGALGGQVSRPGEGEAPRRQGALREGGAIARKGRGLPDAAPGEERGDGARKGWARPMVREGTPSVPAVEEGRPHDTVDSEQEGTGMRASIVHASSAGGSAGPGSGGEAGAGTVPASGGKEGVGARAAPLGTGGGAFVDNSAFDRKRTAYLRSVLAKIHPLWANAFPKWAALAGLQGTVIISFAIYADGRVGEARVTRTSRIAEFDENCRQAVLRAAPFAPLPDGLGPVFRWSLPFEARNPAVRPKTP